MSSLSALLDQVERGDWLPADPWLTLTRAPSPQLAAVLSFPGHAVIAADLDPSWIDELMPAGDLAAPLNPPFLHACEQKLGLRVNCVDGLYLAPPVAGRPELPLREVTDLDHPRVSRARRYRPQLRIWTTPGAVLVVGRGLAGRWETAIEVDPALRGSGLGRALARAARQLVPEQRPVWAQVAPGNAASVRAFLAAGYRPVGAEALLVP